MAIFLLKRRLTKIVFAFVILLASSSILYEFGKFFRHKKRETNSIHTSYSSQPYIFIGGYGRSGTTLIRAILDVHPDIKCGPETKVIPTFIKYAVDWKKKNGANLRRDLKYAGIEMSVVDSGIINFIGHIMSNRGFNVPRLCAKDPDTIYYTEYLHELFPNAKFIYMVRDGRAAAYSYMQQINEVMNFRKYKSYLFSWANFNRKVSDDCKKLGSEYCMQVRYEDLVLHPEKTINQITRFLNVKWTNELLKHHDHIGSKISVSKTEWSSHQIIKPINSESLYAWIGKIDLDWKQLKPIIPILSRFNYSFNISRPQVDKVDLMVVKNNQLIKDNREYWDNKGKNYSDHIRRLDDKTLRHKQEIDDKMLILEREKRFHDKFLNDFNEFEEKRKYH